MIDSKLKKRTLFTVCPALLLVLCLQSRLVAAETTGSTVDYNRDVRPILSDTCFKCHGFDPAARKGKLRLDRPEDAFADRGGYAAIVPGHPEKSEAFKRLVSHDGDETMPPEKSGLKLSPKQVEIF